MRDIDRIKSHLATWPFDVATRLVYADMLADGCDEALEDWQREGAAELQREIAKWVKAGWTFRPIRLFDEDEGPMGFMWKSPSGAHDAGAEYESHAVGDDWNNGPELPVMA